jgi:hypothetical protein
MMGEHKQPVAMQLSPDADTFDNSLPSEKRGTGPDQYDMQRMGKTQETKVGSLSADYTNDGSMLKNASVTSDSLRYGGSQWFSWPPGRHNSQRPRSRCSMAVPQARYTFTLAHLLDSS